MTKFDLFRELLALSYEADKVEISEQAGHLVVEEDNEDHLLHGRAIMNMAHVCHLSAYVFIENDKPKMRVF
jgi:hypothetical protein